MLNASLFCFHLEVGKFSVQLNDAPPPDACTLYDVTNYRMVWLHKTVNLNFCYFFFIHFVFIFGYSPLMISISLFGNTSRSFLIYALYDFKQFY